MRRGDKADPGFGADESRLWVLQIGTLAAASRFRNPLGFGQIPEQRVLQRWGDGSFDLGFDLGGRASGSHVKDGQHEADECRDEGRDPFGPAEEIA